MRSGFRGHATALALVLSCVISHVRGDGLRESSTPSTSPFAAATGACAAGPDWQPAPEGQPIDLAAFLGLDWQGATPDGLLFAQTADGPFRTIIKFSEWTWERWKITDSQILHWEDHNVDDLGQPLAAGVYRFTHNGWFPRHTIVGQVVAYERNWLLRLDGRANEIDRHPHPYRVRTVALEVERTSGKRRVMMEYDPGGDRTARGAPRDTYERYCFVEGEGWRWWGEFSEDDDSLRSANGWSGEPRFPDLVPVRGFVPLNPPLPSVTLARVTPRDGRAPLRVSAVSTSTGPDDIDLYEWVYRERDQDWRVAGTSLREQRNYTFVFNEPGVYEVGVRALGPGGSRVAEETVAVRVTPSHHHMAAAARRSRMNRTASPTRSDTSKILPTRTPPGNL